MPDSDLDDVWQQPLGFDRGEGGRCNRRSGAEKRQSEVRRLHSGRNARTAHYARLGDHGAIAPASSLPRAVPALSVTERLPPSPGSLRPIR